MAKSAKDFKSYQDYLQYLAYGHGTGVFKKTPGHQKIKIRGRAHKVKHTR